jgi:ADP-ribose pyrophosphatase
MDFAVDKVSTPTGETMVRNYLQHPNSVGIIAMDDQGRIAVEHQYRHPVRAKLVEAPAGLCDIEGEAFLDTAKRELAEELGLAAETWQVLVDVYATPGCSTQTTRIFLARDLTEVPRPEGFLLEGEEADMELSWADLDDLVDAIFAGQVKNPTIIVGVLALKTALVTGSLDELRQD